MMLTLMILALPATDAGLMNRTEHQALLRLRDAQPTPLCSRLMTWTDSKDPCTWAGITCNEGGMIMPQRSALAHNPKL